MTQSSYIQSEHIGEDLALALGFGLSTLAVFARTYTKVHLTQTFKKEDFLSVLAWLFFLAYIAIAVVIGKHHGSNEHIAYLSSVELTIYNPIIVLAKVSILLQYITLFVVHRGTFFHYFVHVLIWTNILCYTLTVLLFIFECTPRRKFWDPTISGHCFSQNQIGVTSGVINVVSDLLILISPLSRICRLQMSRNKKARVIAVFGFGLFACIASVLRLIYSSELIHVYSNNAAYQPDIDRLGLWEFAEIAIGIIVGCLPVLPKFFKHFASKEVRPLSRFYSLSSTGPSSWRRFFRKPTTAELSGDDAPQSPGKSFSSEKASRSMRAPHIETLNLTRNSLHFDEMVMPAAVLRNTTVGVEREGYREDRRVVDGESAIPAGWN